MSIVQQVSGQSTIGGTPLILPNPVSAGNTLIAALAERGAGINFDYAAEGWSECPDGQSVNGGGDAVVIIYKHTLGTESQVITPFAPLSYTSGTLYEVEGVLTPGAHNEATGTGFTISSGSITAETGFSVGIGAQGVGGGYDSVAGAVTYAIGSGWTEDHDHATAGGGHPTVVVGHRFDAGTYAFEATNELPSGDAWIGQVVNFAGPPPPPQPGITFSINDVDITDAFEKEIRVELDGTGNGSFKINRHSALATATNLAQGNVVKVRYDRISADPIFAFFLEEGDFGLVSRDEEGGENLTFSGRGVRSILRRAVMWSQSYLSTTKAILGPVQKWIWTKSGSALASRTSVAFPTETLYDIDSIESLAYTPVPDYPTRIYGRLSSGPYAGKYVNQAWFATPYAGVGSWKLWAFSPHEPGAMLYRIISEVQAVGRPQNPLAAVTLDFTDTTDSNGDPWDSFEAVHGFTVQIGENVDDIVQRMIDLGTIKVIMTPDLVLHAYNAYGRDLHGALSDTTVRFERGLNIADELQRSMSPELPGTHVLIDGDDDIVATAELADAASRPTVEVFASFEGSDTGNLADAGLALLEDGVNRLESARLLIEIPKDDPHDPAAGDYLPGPEGTNGDFWIGDLVSLHTGSSTIDYTNRSATVSAITISEDDAANLQVVPEVDSIFHDARPRRELRYGRFEGFTQAGRNQGRGILPGRVIDRTPTNTELTVALGPTGSPLGADLDISAVDVTYDNTSSGLTGTDVQGAIDELAASGSSGGQYRAWLFSASGGTLTILTAVDGTPLTGLMDLE